MNRSNKRRPMADCDHAAVLRALETIQAAQLLILSAAERLSDVPRMANEWEAVVDLHAAVKKTWHAIDERRAVLRRVSEPAAPAKGGVR